MKIISQVHKLSYQMRVIFFKEQIQNKFQYVRRKLYTHPKKLCLMLQNLNISNHLILQHAEN